MIHTATTETTIICALPGNHPEGRGLYMPQMTMWAVDTRPVARSLWDIDQLSCPFLPIMGIIWEYSWNVEFGCFKL